MSHFFFFSTLMASLINVPFKIFRIMNMNSTTEEIHGLDDTEKTKKYDFEVFDHIDVVNVLTYLGISICKYKCKYFVLLYF